MDKPLLVFDGTCGFCNRVCRSLYRGDRHHRLHFLSRKDFEEQQKQLPETMRQQYPDTLLYFEDKQVYMYSEAAIRAGMKVGGIWKCAVLMHLIPVAWRNSLYQFFASKRYCFGKSNNCFLDD